MLYPGRDCLETVSCAIVLASILLVYYAKLGCRISCLVAMVQLALQNSHAATEVSQITFTPGDGPQWIQFAARQKEYVATSHPSLCEFKELGLYHGIIPKTTLFSSALRVFQEGKTCLGFTWWWRYNRILVSTWYLRQVCLRFNKHLTSW